MSNIKLLPKKPKTAKVNEAQQIMANIYNMGQQQEPATTRDWSSLDGLHQAIAEAIIVANNSMVELFSIPGIIENIENRAETKISIEGLNRDIIYFTDELKKIKAMHAGKVGPVDEEDDIGLFLQTFEHYHALNNRYHSVILPTVLTLTEEVGKAGERIKDMLAQTQAETNAQNPNVVTDVLVKEVKIETPKDNSNV